MLPATDIPPVVKTEELSPAVVAFHPVAGGPGGELGRRDESIVIVSFAKTALSFGPTLGPFTVESVVGE